MRTLMRFLRGDASPGLKIMVVSPVLLLVCAIPLLLYIMLGPADGNPIGLGLLFVAGTVISAALFLLGVLWLIVEQVVKSMRA